MADSEERFYWPCSCTSPEWQKEFGARQPRCGVCLSVRNVLDKSSGEIAGTLHRLLQAQSLMSSWVAVSSPAERIVSVPRDVAVLVAGWRHG